MANNLSITLKMVDQISSKLEQIAGAGDKVSERFNDIGSKADSAMNKATSGTDKITQSMQSASEAANNLTSSESQAQQALEQTANSSSNAASEIERVGNESDNAAESAENFGNNGVKAAEAVSNALVALGIVKLLEEIRDAYFEADDAADQFETTIAKVGTIADPAREGLSEIKDEIKALSKDTGVAVDALGEATYGAISASVDTAQAVGFVSQANALAVGGFTAIETSVDVLTTTLNAYNLEATEATRVADVLINTQNLGKTTVDELASSIGQLIPTAAAYNIEIEQLGAAYAILTASGINTANSTTYLNRMFTELSDSGSEVAKVLKQETGMAFADLMEEGKNIGDVIQILGRSVNNNATAFSNLWGSAIAGRGALSLLNAGSEKFTDTLISMQNAAGSADIAFEKMTSTGEYVQQKFDNSVDNLKIAIGEAQPQLDGLMIAGTKVIDKLSEFVDKHPNVVKAIESIALGLGIFVTGITTYIAVSTAATIATEAFTTALISNPFIFAATAIIALGTAFVTLAVSTNDADAAESQLTSTSQKLADKISAQEKTVESLTDKYGEHNEKTIEAKSVLAELEAEYNATGETMAEFRAKNEAAVESLSNTMQAYNESVGELNESEIGVETMIASLERLSNQSNLTAFQQSYMAEIITRMNSKYPELNLSIDENTKKLNMSTDRLREYAKAQVEARIEEQKAQTYVDLLYDQAMIEERLAETQRNRAQAVEDLAYIESHLQEYAEANKVENGEYADALNSARDKVKEFTQAEEDLQRELENANSSISDFESAAEKYSDSINNATQNTNELKSANEQLASDIAMALTQPSEAMKEFGETWFKVLDSNREKVAGMVGVFGEVKEAAGTAFKDIEGLWEKQIDYLNNYNTNLEKAREYGLNSDLLSGLADGSAESAATLDNIIEKIDEVSKKGEDVSAFVNDFNSKFEELGKAQETLAETMTSLDKELKDKLDVLKQEMETGIDKLNLDSEAAAAARNTMNAYISQLQQYGAQAISEANQIAAEVAAALEKAESSKSKKKEEKKKHATGTTYGENVYIAGEYGPELIVNRVGSEVFPASETAKILRAIDNDANSYQTITPSLNANRYMNQGGNESMAPDVLGMDVSKKEISNISSRTENRNVTLTIKGKGNLGVPSGASLNEVKAYISAELENAIMAILQKEMYEEGKVAYEF